MARETTIQLRCALSEKELLRVAAERAGMPLSQWVRQVCLLAAKKGEARELLGRDSIVP